MTRASRPRRSTGVEEVPLDAVDMLRLCRGARLGDPETVAWYEEAREYEIAAMDGTPLRFGRDGRVWAARVVVALDDDVVQRRRAAELLEGDERR